MERADKHACHRFPADKQSSTRDTETTTPRLQWLVYGGGGVGGTRLGCWGRWWRRGWRRISRSDGDGDGDGRGFQEEGRGGDDEAVWPTSTRGRSISMHQPGSIRERRSRSLNHGQSNRRQSSTPICLDITAYVIVFYQLSFWPSFKIVLSNQLQWSENCKKFWSVAAGISSEKGKLDSRQKLDFVRD
ncbi:hypothetical protein HPP92_003570 [Vanilla planifolia]|uniref:Uncharacterized protein n=1 Tax=Vanilla planifolia TaxID=51239 RepID=A0A835VFK9_VANPL|nr:hypothetical protein HPP92_003570 [Vanilla planifolia]